MPALKLKTIPQAKLARYYELKQLTEEMDALKEEILLMAQNGLPCQPGRYACAIDTNSRVSPKWKEEGRAFVQQTGHDPDKWEADVKKRTPASTSSTLRVFDREKPMNGSS